MIRKILTIVGLAIYLFFMVSATSMFVTDFSKIKKLGGGFLTYLNLIILLLGVFLITWYLIKTLKKKA